VKEYAKQLGVFKLAPHDLRRSGARLCHDSGGANWNRSNPCLVMCRWKRRRNTWDVSNVAGRP
jgi:hypothetical protein